MFWQRLLVSLLHFYAGCGQPQEALIPSSKSLRFGNRGYMTAHNGIIPSEFPFPSSSMYCGPGSPEWLPMCARENPVGRDVCFSEKVWWCSSEKESAVRNKAQAESTPRPQPHPQPSPQGVVECSEEDGQETSLHTSRGAAET